MMTRCRLICSAALLALFAHGGVSALETETGSAMQITTETTFESCADARGRTLPAEADAALPELVRVVATKNGVGIRYNPGLFPHLSGKAKIFLYMSQCARQGLYDVGKIRQVTEEQARRADCMAADALLANGLVMERDLPALAAELVFTSAEWRQLPGPARTVDLQNCAARRTSGNALRLPSAAPPGVDQTRWNQCVRGCADKLWVCQRGGSEGRCLDGYNRCQQACGATGKPSADGGGQEK
ncbi:MAG: hypothetical protein LBE33_09475 [Zoogloeaceae bacterium]|jgi:hypothetical protein|nr:hypothetical protein [Zoogloeaceae bacterium]